MGLYKVSTKGIYYQNCLTIAGNFRYAPVAGFLQAGCHCEAPFEVSVGIQKWISLGKMPLTDKCLGSESLTHFSRLSLSPKKYKASTNKDSSCQCGIPGVRHVIQQLWAFLMVIPKLWGHRKAGGEVLILSSWKRIYLDFDCSWGRTKSIIIIQIYIIYKKT